MSEGGYKIRNKEGIHFITFAVVEWVDVFTRKEYKDIVLDSLRHCQKERGLVVYSWCIMSNHIHLVVSAKQNNTSEVLRDFKKFTSKAVVKAINDHPGESRKEWMLEIFRKAGASNGRNTIHQFWRQDNQPKELFSSGFTRQKLEYIHNNPVEPELLIKRKNIVTAVQEIIMKGRILVCLKLSFWIEMICVLSCKLRTATVKAPTS